MVLEHTGRTCPGSRIGQGQHKQRPTIGVLGKWITRRSRGACELCDERHETRLFELYPFPEEPRPERILMACKRCRTWLQKGHIDPRQARFLGVAVWHEEPAIRLAAGRLLLCNPQQGAVWVRDALEASRIDPETLELRERLPEGPL